MSRSYSRSVTGSLGLDTGVSPVVEVIAKVARAIWPFAPAKQLAARTRNSHRSAEDWLSLRTGMSADALADILRSDQGDVFLEAIMADCPRAPSWWPNVRSEVRAHAIERRLDGLRAEIEEARRDLEMGGEVRAGTRGPARRA